jgi:hypothetical protein
MIQEIDLSDITVDRTTPVPAHVVESMAKDIEANGLKQPLIIDRWGTLIDGLTRLRALEHLGYRKIPVEVANSLEEALALLKALQFDPRTLSVRRRRDFAESLDGLLREHTKMNLRGRNSKPKSVKTPQTRDLVGEVLGYPWFRIRRIFRWLEEDLTDPYRLELIDALESGHITPNRLYTELSHAGVQVLPRITPAVPRNIRLRAAKGDIILAGDQRHLLKELSRQLSGAVKGAAKLSFPLNIPSEETEQFIDELARHRAALTVFIKALRKEVTPQ